MTTNGLEDESSGGGRSECPTCDHRFDSETGMKIHHARVHGESISGVEVDCAQCGATIRRKPKDIKRSENLFCSLDCHGEWVSENVSGEDHPSWGGGEVKVACAWCGDEKHVVPAEVKRNERHFCGKECEGSWKSEHRSGENHPSHRGRLVTEPCSTCSTPVEYYEGEKGHQNHHFCDLDCFSVWCSQSRVGKHHPSWEGGWESYYGANWTQQRTRALDRDGHECAICGAGKDEIGREPDVHHIVPIRCFSSKRAANCLGNLITLCPTHHRKAEKGAIDAPTPASPLTPQIVDD